MIDVAAARVGLTPAERAELDALLLPRAPWLTLCLTDPARFVCEGFVWAPGDGPTPYQIDIMQTLVSTGRVAAFGPHGLGKTALAAWLVHWFALTRDSLGLDWKIPITASAWRQLDKFLWPEIHKWARRLRWDRIGRAPYNERTELLQLQLQLRHGAAFALASDDPALIEGAHAESLFYLYDEAKAIPAGTFDASEGAFSGAWAATNPREAFALAVSTPGEPVGRFADICHRKPGYEDWRVRAVAQAEVIAAGRMSAPWAEQKARQWGPTSAVYQNRVLGQFAANEAAGLIPLAWVEAAIARWHAWVEAGRPGAFRSVGADIARSGRDQTVLAPWIGPAIDTLRYYSHQDTMTTTGRIVGILQGAGVPNRLTAPRLFAYGQPPVPPAIVDVVGLGGGPVDRLREQGWYTIAFQAGGKTAATDHSGEFTFVNRRSHAWWHLRELLDPDLGASLALPPDDQLIGDLTAIRYRHTSSGAIAVEGKDDEAEGDPDHPPPRSLRARLGRSPDAGDAVVMAVYPVAGELTEEEAGLAATLAGWRG